MYIYVTKSTQSTYSPAHGKILHSITAFCIRDYDWPVAEITLEQPDQPWEPIQFLFVTICGNFMVTCLVAMAILQGWLYFLLGFHGMLLVFTESFHEINRPYYRLCKRIGPGPQSIGGAVFTALTMAYGIHLTWRSLENLFHQRRKLRALSGDQYIDDEWGFGQVTTVMGWVPVIQDFVLSIIIAVDIASGALSQVGGAPTSWAEW